RALLDSLPLRHEAAAHVGAGSGPPLIQAKSLCVECKKKAPLFWRKPTVFRAVEEADFDIFAGETLAIVGESGSGKTTLGRALVRLVRESSGSIRFDGQEITGLSGHALKHHRLQTQMVF